MFYPWLHQIRLPVDTWRARHCLSKASWITMGCIHGNLVPSPAVPELVPSSENGRSICIHWPMVIHATAYTVELFEEGTAAGERFTRSVPESMAEALVELRVGNLQP